MSSKEFDKFFVKLQNDNSEDLSHDNALLDYYKNNGHFDAWDLGMTVDEFAESIGFFKRYPECKPDNSDNFKFKQGVIY